MNGANNALVQKLYRAMKQFAKHILVEVANVLQVHTGKGGLSQKGCHVEPSVSTAQSVTVHSKQLPKGTFVKLRPLEAGYDPEDWKALLEMGIMTTCRYSAEPLPGCWCGRRYGISAEDARVIARPVVWSLRQRKLDK